MDIAATWASTQPHAPEASERRFVDSWAVDDLSAPTRADLRALVRESESSYGEPREPRRVGDRTREATRLRHLSRRTEENADLHWMQSCDRRNPAQLGAQEMSDFLTHLAVREQVSASTQYQALAALVFPFRHVLSLDPPVRVDHTEQSNWIDRRRRYFHGQPSKKKPRT